jgi:tRNA-splicing ligase RtcB
VELKQIDKNLWEIPKQGGMRVPGRIYASATLMKALRDDPCLTQVANVAHLPGIVGYSLAMPDIHWGYGFPIGGVAATRVADGVISPGGVGYDINCGVRLVRTGLVFSEVQGKTQDLVRSLFQHIPCGVGMGGAIPKLNKQDVQRVLTQGARWAVESGFGSSAVLDATEEGGTLKNADAQAVSDVAIERGAKQLGTLGSGNHFLEVDRVEEIYLPQVADRCGLQNDGIVFIIHSGSRGLGYQVCDDYLEVMEKAMRRYQISLPDRQLACAPIQSEEGQTYLRAMAAAANFAWCNRQVMTALAEKSFLEALNVSPRELQLRLVYDVCHNIAKLEKHNVGGKTEQVCVHRKGATRAFGPGQPEVPECYRDLGQPVLIPGDMGRGSYLLVGTTAAMEKTFGSTCHGAGRVMSRTQSKKVSRGRDLIKEMSDQGVSVMFHGRGTLAEEMPHAYKNVSDVVDVMEEAGISLKVAKFKPIGVIKG